MRGWVTAGVAATAVIAVIAVTGGFATVPDTSGAPVPPGEVISLGSFDVRVDRAELVEDRLRVHAQLVNRTAESVGYLPYNVITVALPDGEVLTTGRHDGVDGWQSGLDPDIPALATIDFDLTRPGAPAAVTVILRGLEPSGGFLSGPTATAPGRVRAVVALPVTR